MDDVQLDLGHWQLDVNGVRVLMYRASTPRERERWHSIWLLGQGWPVDQVAEALERDARTIGEWLADFQQHGPAGLAFEQSGGSPPSSVRHSKLS
jgi:transposase